MEPIRSGRRGYVDLDTLHTENLDLVAETFHLALGTPKEKTWLINGRHRLPCWPDSVSGVRIMANHITWRYITLMRNGPDLCNIAGCRGPIAQLVRAGDS